MSKFFKDFKAFISRGNVVDMAIGVIIATAFTAIVTALANKIIMPFINWILTAVVGKDGLSSIYTFLSKAYTVDAKGNQIIDLTNSIYIDWGAFITAVIDFFLIALVLFMILKIFMNAQKTANSKLPNRQERKELRTRGVNLLNHKEVSAKLTEIRAEKKAAEDAEKAANYKPTTEELLTQILEELKKQNNK